jgi:hypothetical protein
MSEATPLTFSEEGQQRFLQQAFSLWVTPEHNRRPMLAPILSYP